MALNLSLGIGFAILLQPKLRYQLIERPCLLVSLTAGEKSPSRARGAETTLLRPRLEGAVPTRVVWELLRKWPRGPKLWEVAGGRCEMRLGSGASASIRAEAAHIE